MAPVVLYHAGFSAFRGGFVGVDVFFVISGYLITGVIHSEMGRGDFSIVNFYERRVRRILPALYLVVLVCLPFAWLWLFPREMAQFARSIVAVSLFTSNIFFNKEIGYFSSDVDLWPLIHTWSLAVEEQFYAIFPLLLLLSIRLKTKYVFAWIAALSALSLAWAQRTSHSDPQSDFYLLQTRTWELGLGALIALIPEDRLKLDPRIRSSLAALGLALLGYAVVFFGPDIGLPSLWSLAPVGGAALLIAFATSETALGKLLGVKPLAGVGLVSYSAYLWHQPIFAFARFRFDTPPAGAAMLLLSAASFALAYVSWRFVERPFRDRKRFSRSFIFIGAVVVAALLVASARMIVTNRGLPMRMPPIAGADDIGAYRNECLDIADLRPASLARMTACRLGRRDAAPDFLLIGDSRAASLADGVSVAASREGRSGLVVASNACLPIVGLRTQFARSEEACRRLHDDMFEIVDTLGIKLVLMHARWEAMDEKVGLDDKENARDATREEIYERLLKTLSAFASRGVKVVIITGTPHAPHQVPDIMARKARYGLVVDERADLRQFLFENRTAMRMFADPEIDKYATIFDLYPFFCGQGSDGRCAVAQGSRPYFFDDSHLSLFGSLALSPMLENVFK